MKSSELRSLHDLTAGELEEKLAATKQELFNLRFQLVTGHLEDHARVKTLRRNVAQLQTMIAQRQTQR
ncbi:MAG: 50S ribosomal protein L29 [Candidatus Eremiobacteraeota bacterium]|nr:50S ribosomal protein L29 [Candidatus Eremiobacteraeota bacterium]MBC5826649.1 50S ribosomal protein L29 [Candidatus Eremiobacteraeota bacterium]